MRLLAWAPAMSWRNRSPRPVASAREGANKRAECAGTASPSRERKLRRGGACRRTTARRATDSRLNRRDILALFLLPGGRESALRPSAVGWRVRRSGGRKAQRASQQRRGTPRWFVLRRHAEG